MKQGILFAAALSLMAPKAEAFCGFYVSGADAKLFNNATQVALLRDGTRTVLSMQNAYQGPPENFAMVVPVPVVLQKENVKTLPRALFDRLDQLTAPRLVEYWEQDPCTPEPEYSRFPPTPMMAPAAAPGGPRQEGYGVTVEAQFEVGEYEVVVLSARDSTGLEAWLRDNRYKIPDGAAPYLNPYVQNGSKFFVARVNVAKVTFEGGQAVLSPLRFYYDTDKFDLPIRLGLINSSGTQDLIVTILARGQRYQVANYPNVTIPTNLDVAEQARGQFGTFYAALFDRTLEKTPRAVVTEYSWDASSCDPCPTPALTPAELMTLGADTLPGGANVAPGIGPGGPGAPRMRPPMMQNLFGFVVTRLHARYTKSALGDDLVFVAAPPIQGGREFMGANGTLEKGAATSGTNNFQARYAIRHPWTGPVTCEKPRRGQWGGPPSGTPQATPKAAARIAFTPRGALQLAAFVKEDIPELDLKGLAPPPSGVPAIDSEPSMPKTGPKSGCGSCTLVPSSRDPFGVVSALGLVLAGIGSALRRKKR